MALSVSSIIANRSHAIVSAFVTSPTILVQVESASALRLLGQIQEIGIDGADPQALGRRNAGKVIYVANPQRPDLNASVWVAAGYGDYRAAYLAFLNKAYDLRATKADLGGFDADHLLNRARSPSDDTLIRLEGVDPEINQEWGALFEKAASDGRFYANTLRKRRTMSYMICAKLAGQSPPKGPQDQAGILRLALFFERIGIPRGEAQQGLKSMLDFAYKFR